MNILGEKTKKLGIDRTCDNRLKPCFYLIPICGNKKINRKAKPSVRVGFAFYPLGGISRGVAKICFIVFLPHHFFPLDAHWVFKRHSQDALAT